mgnify:CR=1 FL=1
MSRVKIVRFQEGIMYPVRDILDFLKGELRQKALYISPAIAERILANLIVQKGKGTICRYGDLYIPKGYSITLKEISFIKNLYMIYWLTDEHEYVYSCNTIPENHESYLFCLEGEDVRKQEEALNRMRSGT